MFWPSESKVLSAQAAFLLTRPCYAVLKNWKKRRGGILDSWLQKEWTHRISVPHTASIALPIPQSFLRSWRLGGSPAYWLARHLASRSTLQLRSDLLLFQKEHHPQKRQAERGQRERWGRINPFQASAALMGMEVVLVDDFLTTGSTLRLACEALRRGGASGIHVRVLGYRAQRLSGGSQ